MAVDITKLLEELQRRISASDANTSENDLYYMVKAVSRGDGSSLSVYDSAGALPVATPAASSNATVGYDNNFNILYTKKAQWSSVSFYPEFRNQGQTGGYYAGGKAPGTPSNPNASPWTNTIEFFPFSSEGSVTDVANAGNSDTMGSWSSATHGYIKGKRDSANSPTPTPGDTTRLEKFTFGSSTPVIGIANVGPAPINGIQGEHAWQSPQRSAGCFGNFAYAYGVNTDPAGYETSGLSEQTYEKFPYASEDILYTVGDATPNQWGSTGVQSLDHGYIAGGFNPLSPATGKTAVRRMPFYSDNNDTGVGDLAVGRFNPNRQYDKVGVSSQQYGYIGGGQPQTSFNLSEGYEKFAWSNNVTGSVVGQLTTTYMVESIEGISGENNGYWVAGKIYIPAIPPTSTDQLNNIRKFPYSSDVDTSSVGTLGEARYWGSSMQY